MNNQFSRTRESAIQVSASRSSLICKQHRTAVGKCEVEKVRTGHRVPLLIIALLAACPAICAQQHWGDFATNQCTSPGLRQYSSILWGINGSWEAACAGMPADINGRHFAKPSRCVNTGTAMWGQFDVPDNTCANGGPHWGPFKRDACSLVGKRQFSSIIADVPAGMTWEQACQSTPAIIQGQSFPNGPRFCSNQPTGMWGEFDVNDAGCPDSASTSHFVSNHCAGVCVYPKPTYLNVFWEAPGKWDKDVTAALQPARTEAAINAFVRTLTGSAYFKGLAQYGVGQPTFMNSVDANADCLKQYPVPTTADLDHIARFVSCEVNSLNLPSTDNLIVNLFLPPSVTPAWINASEFINVTVHGQPIIWGGCPNDYGAYHFLTALALVGKGNSALPTVPFTVIPSNPTCSHNDFSSLTELLSHEMVEAATDPGGFGWFDNSANTIFATGTPLTEIADFCEGGKRSFFPEQTLPFSTGAVESYWSNNPPGCVFGGLK
jgi:hypothetical protein